MARSSDWIACVQAEVTGERVPVFTRGVPFLLGLVGPKNLVFERNGSQLEVYVYEPKKVAPAPRWVFTRYGKQFYAWAR